MRQMLTRINIAYLKRRIEQRRKELQQWKQICTKMEQALACPPDTRPTQHSKPTRG